MSQIADAAASVAIAGFLFFAGTDGPSRMQLLQMVVTAAVPLVLAGPLAGHLSDIVPRRRLLVIGQVARAATLVGVAVTASAGRTVPTLACIAVSLSLTRILYTARSASVRHVVRRDDLVGADSLMLAASSVSGLLGAGVGLLLHHVTGLVVLLVAGAGHLTAAALFARIDVPLGGGHSREETHAVRVIEQIRSPRIRFAFVATSWNRLLLGVMFATVALAGPTSRATASGGLVVALSAVGTGSFIGTLLAERMGARWGHIRVASHSFLGSALACTVAALSGTRVVTVAGLAVAATAFQSLRVCSDASVQATAQHGSGGRLFAGYDIAHNLAFLGGIGVALGATTIGSHSIVIATLVPAHLAAATATRAREVRMRRGAGEARRYGRAHGTDTLRSAQHDDSTDLGSGSVTAIGGGGQHHASHQVRPRDVRGRPRRRAHPDRARPHRPVAGRRIG
jgi:predicted MFS family arabinose efflux permease